MKTDKKYASVFELNGMPKFSQAFPLALQHVVAMIVGCVTPAIVIAGVAGLEGNDKVIFAGSVVYCCNFHIDSVVSAWRKDWFRSSGHHGSQLCVSTKYAGNRRKF